MSRPAVWTRLLGQVLGDPKVHEWLFTQRR